MRLRGRARGGRQAPAPPARAPPRDLGPLPPPTASPAAPPPPPGPRGPSGRARSAGVGGARGRGAGAGASRAGPRAAQVAGSPSKEQFPRLTCARPCLPRGAPSRWPGAASRRHQADTPTAATTVPEARGGTGAQAAGLRRSEHDPAHGACAHADTPGAWPGSDTCDQQVPPAPPLGAARSPRLPGLAPPPRAPADPAPPGVPGSGPRPGGIPAGVGWARDPARPGPGASPRRREGAAGSRGRAKAAGGRAPGAAAGRGALLRAGDYPGALGRPPGISQAQEGSPPSSGLRLGGGPWEPWVSGRRPFGCGRPVCGDARSPAGGFAAVGKMKAFISVLTQLVANGGEKPVAASVPCFRTGFQLHAACCLGIGLNLVS